VFELFKAGRHFDYAIGVCDEEHGQRCPLFAGMTQRLYWSFPDPSSFTGERAAVVKSEMPSRADSKRGRQCFRPRGG
jgi:arsenate reductase